MVVRNWRFAAFMLAALTAAMGFCHLLEMPARLSWDSTLWVATTVTGGLYRMFGTVGALIVVATVIATVGLAVVVRRRGLLVFRLTAAGAALYVVALLAWWVVVFPVNLQLEWWTPDNIPADWDVWRARWEFGHAAITLLELAGLASLLASMLLETPAEDAAAAAMAGKAVARAESGD